MLMTMATLPFATVNGQDSSDWEVLFDGSSVDHWRGYSQEEIGAGWMIEDGALKCAGGSGGDIVTQKTYGDFELEFEWQISPGGNSGVMYRVRLGDGASYFSGPEYQILDDGPDGNSGDTSAASLYGLYAPQDKTLHEPGKWNTARIVQRGNQIEHWLNGKQVVSATIGSDEWNEKVAATKFKAWPQFAAEAEGHICLQDHGNPVSFRNIRIRRLTTD